MVTCQKPLDLLGRGGCLSENARAGSSVYVYARGPVEFAKIGTLNTSFGVALKLVCHVD